jgi:type III restriction enzyme/adenine-specific DNA-methyltransferase
MVKDIIDSNNNIKPGDKELEVLRENFPACFHSDGSFDLARFKEYLTDKIYVTSEGYELRFLGKNYARLLASIDTTTVIVPDEEHNAKPENKDSKNIYISGDNIDALKHLLKSYSGKIKCIYIDPPYNTGSDGFVYNDSFDFTVGELVSRLSIDEEQAARILDLTRRGSSSHSAWLMFMLPRLVLARDLLTEDGVIFISIDDNEQGNLKLLCDDVFGEENMIAQIVIQANKRGQTYKQLAKTHEYLLVYTKSDCAIINEFVKEIKGDVKSDTVGEFTERELRNRNPKYGKFNRPNLFYPIYVNTSVVDKNGYSPVSAVPSLEYALEVLPYNSEGQESCWRWGTNKLDKNNNVDSMLSNVVARKKTTGEYGIYEKYRKGTYKAKTIWFDMEIVDDEDDDDSIDEQIWDETGVITEQGTSELKKYDMSETFDFPKPTYLIKKILTLGSNLDSICLDFFSGSATMADAVMQLNVDGGNRTFIAVQLPLNLTDKYKTAPVSDKPKIKNVIDFLTKNGYKTTLDNVGIERIKRAANKIKQNSGSFHGDLGFKHYILKKPSAIALEKIATFNPKATVADVSLADEFGNSTILTTWLVRDGYTLNPNVRVVDLCGYKAYYCDKHIYIIHQELSNEAIDALVSKFENDASFNPLNVVVYGYALNWTELQALKDNLQRLKVTDKNIRVNIDIRY